VQRSRASKSAMRRIPYFWIRDVDPQTYMRALKMARAHKQSVADTARELLYRSLRTDAPDQTRAPKVKVKVRRI
jgi:hypothetical protein